MKRIPFSILIQDYENSGKDYHHIDDCPATAAFKRQFNINFTLGHDGKVIDLSGKGLIGTYEYTSKNDEWNRARYNALVSGTEFHTFINIPEKYLAPDMTKPESYLNPQALADNN